METNTKKHNDWTFEKVTNIEQLYEIGFWNSFIIRNHFSGFNRFVLQENETPSIFEYLKKIFSNNSDSHILIAKNQKGKAVDGLLIADYFMVNENTPAVYFHDFFINPQLSGNGTGTKILESFIKQCPELFEQKPKYFLTYLHQNNVPYKKLLEKLNFKISHSGNDFFLQAELNPSALENEQNSKTKKQEQIEF